MVNDPVAFKDVQPAGLWLKALFLALAVGCFALVGVANGAAGGIAVATFLLGFLFHALRVEVQAAQITVAFGPGWPRRTIPISRVVGQRAVRNRWWYGFGIRYTPHGWLWNLDGLDAVELDLSNGRQFRIGTRVPRDLCEAIAAARAACAAPSNDEGTT